MFFGRKLFKSPSFKKCKFSRISRRSPLSNLSNTLKLDETLLTTAEGAIVNCTDHHVLRISPGPFDLQRQETLMQKMKHETAPSRSVAAAANKALRIHHLSPDVTVNGCSRQSFPQPKAQGWEENPMFYSSALFHSDSIGAYLRGQRTRMREASYQLIRLRHRILNPLCL